MREQLIARLEYRDSNHSYHLDGKRLPSVTTVLGNLSKPGLVYWSANVGAAAAEQYVLDNAKVIEAGGITAAQLAAQVFDLAKTTHTIRKNKAGAKGNVVHNAIEQYHADFFNATPPDRLDEPAAFMAWSAFIDWWRTAGLTVVSTERKIVDSLGRYAGRLDLLCADADEDLFVCDIKTSNFPNPEHLIQNAAYAAAVEAEIGEEIAGTKVLWLPEDAEKLTVIERSREEWLLDFEMFESLLLVHEHRKTLEKITSAIKRAHDKTKEQEACK